MARSKQSHLKREKEKNKQKKQKDKETRRFERKTTSNKGKGLDALVMVDEYADLDKDKKLAEIRAELSAEKKDILPGEGRVSYCNDQKGYGYIKDNSTKGTVFFQTSSLPAPVKVNDLLSYTIVRGPKGATANNIRKKI